MRNLAKAGPLEAAARRRACRWPCASWTSPARLRSIARWRRRVRARAPSTCSSTTPASAGPRPLELTPEDEHRAMFEANYWGPIRMIQAVLPSMRERRAGCIVNVTLDRGAHRHPEPDPVLRVQARARRRQRGAGPRGGRLRGPRGHHRARRDPDRDLRELGGRHALRQDLAVPADHAPQRQALRRRLPQPRPAGDGRGGDPGGHHHRPAAPALPGGRRRARASPPGAAASATRSGWRWVGELSDEEYNARFKRYFGIELR